MKLLQHVPTGVQVAIIALQVSWMLSGVELALNLSDSGSSARTMRKCNSTTEWCPEGSAILNPIPNGYSLTVTADGEHVLELCPSGTYCVRGVRQECPEGTYGSSSGLSTPYCTAFCLPGMHCAIGSTMPRTCPLGHYCPHGVAVPCPAGRYGDEEGLQVSV